MSVSWVIAGATRRLVAGGRLVAGEPAAPPTKLQLERTLDACKVLCGYRDLRTLQLGPRTILVTLTAEMATVQSVDQFRCDLEQLTAEIKATDLRFEYVFFWLG